jgi:hypothetical protein
VDLHGGHTEGEPRADLGVGEALGEQAQHVSTCYRVACPKPMYCGDGSHALASERARPPRHNCDQDTSQPPNDVRTVVP